MKKRTNLGLVLPGDSGRTRSIQLSVQTPNPQPRPKHDSKPVLLLCQESQSPSVAVRALSESPVPKRLIGGLWRAYCLLTTIQVLSTP